MGAVKNVFGGGQMGKGWSNIEEGGVKVLEILQNSIPLMHV